MALGFVGDDAQSVTRGVSSQASATHLERLGVLTHGVERGGFTGVIFAHLGSEAHGGLRVGQGVFDGAGAEPPVAKKARK